MKRAPDDDARSHARWGDATLPVKAAAERLLSSARGYDPGVRVTLSEIEAAVRRGRRGAGAGMPARLLAAAVAGVVLVTGGVALSRGWLALREPAVPSVTGDRASAPAPVERRRRLRTALRGPAPAAASRPLDGEAAVPRGDTNVGPVSDSAGAGPETSPPALDERFAERPMAVPAPPTERATRPLVPPAGSRIERATPASLVGPLRTLPARPPVSSSVAVPPAVIRSPGVAPPVRSLSPAPPGPAIMPPAFEAAPAGLPAGAETSQIRDALVQLRRERNPARALELVDVYDGRYPAGLWREEAAVIRIEALLALGRSGEALERCEALPQAALDRAPRLRVTRGELRVRYGRCDEAKSDFSAVLGLAVTEEVRGRALRGQAACRK